MASTQITAKSFWEAVCRFCRVRLIEAPHYSWLFDFTVWEAGVITAEGIQLAVRADDMRAAAVNPVFIPCQRVHKRLDEKPERMRLVQFKLLEQFAQRLGFAA